MTDEAKTDAADGWFERTDLCEARIKLSTRHDDHAIVLAVDVAFLRERVEAIRKLADAARSLPDLDDITSLGDIAKLLGAALTAEHADVLLGHIADLLRVCVRSWDLAHYGPGFGEGLPEHAAERDALIRRLPVPVLCRLVEGCMRLLGNL